MIIRCRCVFINTERTFNDNFANYIHIMASCLTRKSKGQIWHISDYTMKQRNPYFNKEKLLQIVFFAMCLKKKIPIHIYHINHIYHICYYHNQVVTNEAFKHSSYGLKANHNLRHFIPNQCIGWISGVLLENWGHFGSMDIWLGSKVSVMTRDIHIYQCPSFAFQVGTLTAYLAMNSVSTLQGVEKHVSVTTCIGVLGNSSGSVARPYSYYWGVCCWKWQNKCI